MKPLVYLAGPYSLPDPVENTHRAIKCAEGLEYNYDVDVFVPHLSLLWHVVSPAPYEKWCERDNAILARCDALVRRPGASSGADAEVKYAHEVCDIPLFWHGAVWDPTCGIAERFGPDALFAWSHGL